MAIPQAYGEPAPLEAGAQVHHTEHLHAVGRNGVLLPHYADLAEAEGLDQFLHHGNVGNGFVGGCRRRRLHPGEFIPSELRAVGAQGHGRRRGLRGAENYPNWLVLLDNWYLLHCVSSKNRNREGHETNESLTLPRWSYRI